MADYLSSMMRIDTYPDAILKGALALLVLAIPTAALSGEAPVLLVFPAAGALLGASAAWAQRHLY